VFVTDNAYDPILLHSPVSFLPLPRVFNLFSFYLPGMVSDDNIAGTTFCFNLAYIGAIWSWHAGFGSSIELTKSPYLKS